MKNFKLILFIALIINFITSQNVYAEEVFKLDLKTGINKFLKDNYDVKISNYDVQKLKGDIDTASLLQNPDFSANVSSFNTVAYKDKDNPDSFAFRINQSFETVNKREYRIKVAQENFNYSKLNYQDNIRNLLTNFIIVYYQVMLDNIQLESAKENYNSFNKLLIVSAIKLEKGFIPELEHTKLEIQQLDFKKDISNSTLNLKTDLENLKYLLSLNENVNIKIKDEMPESNNNLNIDKFVSAALIKRYDLKAAKKSQELAEINIKLNKLNAYPDVTFGIESDSSGPSYKPAIGGGVGFSIPIFNKNQGEIFKSELNKTQSQLNYEKTKRLIVSQVKQSFYILIEKENIFNANKSYFLKLRKLKDNEEKAYILGGINVSDLINAQKIYKDYQKSYNLSMVDLITAKKQLELNAGQLN